MVFSAIAPIWCWLRSARHTTTMPDGMCFMRTAVSTLSHVLPALVPPAAHGRGLEIDVFDLDVDFVFDVGRDFDRREAGLAARVAVERADADWAMHAHSPSANNRTRWDR